MHRMLSSLVLLVRAVLPRAVAQRFPPDSFTNLKVLPKDIAPRDLVNLMAGFTRALGVRCSHCHAGEEGSPLDTYDFAKDDKLLKRKAREVIRMVQAINEQHLTKVEERVEPRLTVTCATCHRGVREPGPLQEILVGAYRAAGLDSALAVYRGLRERDYGRAACGGRVPAQRGDVSRVGERARQSGRGVRGGGGYGAGDRELRAGVGVEPRERRRASKARGAA